MGTDSVWPFSVICKSCNWSHLFFQQVFGEFETNRPDFLFLRAKNTIKV